MIVFLADKLAVTPGVWIVLCICHCLCLCLCLWTYNLLLVVSLAEVLAVALGARLVLVVLPPERVQLLRNASERD